MTAFAHGRKTPASAVDGGRLAAMHIRFAHWAAQQGTDNVPSAGDIQERFQCSRATAYRLRAAWAEVMGLSLEAPVE
jgi:hypothetical protein